MVDKAQQLLSSLMLEHYSCQNNGSFELYLFYLFGVIGFIWEALDD